MNYFYKSILGISCAALVCMQGCTTSADGLPITFPGQEDKTDFDSLSLDAQELVYTRALLDIYYVNADKELKDFEDYYQKGASKGFPATHYEFPDVQYMFSTLSDNYTRYFSPAYAAQILNMLVYSEESIDLGVDVKEVEVPDCDGEEDCDETRTAIVLKHVYPEAPAEKAGMKAGDTVVSVDGIGIQTENAFQKLSNGKDGEEIKVVVKRGEEELTYKAKLESYLAPSVFVDYEDSIPVITITEYIDTTYMSTGTYGEFIKAIKETAGAEATIIDLRGNPGGSIPQCMDMTAELLHKDDTLAIMISHDIDENWEKKYVDTLTWIAEEDGLAKDRYFVFLADTGSASCSELMLVGVTSNTKSPIVGLTTYGKGIGQTYTGTYAGGIAGITSMRMFDKDWKVYHRFGFEPDYVEGDPVKAMEIAVKLAKEKKAVRTKGYGTEDTGHFTLAKSHANSTTPERGGAFVIDRKISKMQGKAFPHK